MKTTNLRQSRPAKFRKWLRRQRRSHDPILVLNISIFNSRPEQIFNPLPPRENVWV